MEKRQKIFSKIAYGCFYTGVIIEVLLVLIDKSALVNPVEGRIFRITFLLFTVKAVLTKYSFREYVVTALFLVLGAISYFVTERNEIVRFVMFIVACKNIDMKKCLKLVFWMTLSGCILIMLLSITGILGTVSLTQDYGRGGVETRYTFGMGHPNALQCMVWALTVLGVYLYGEQMKWYHYVTLFSFNGIFFLLTDSKTSFIAAEFAVVYAGVYHFVKNESVKKICNIAGIFITLESIAISVYIAGNAYHVYNYDWSIDRSAFPTFLKRIDGVLTGRIRSLTGSERWEGTIQTWKLFSEPANNYYFDMGWIRLFYWYGIIPAIIIVFVTIALLIYCVKKKDHMAFVMIVAFAVYTIVEAHAVSVYLARNYVVFILGASWYQMILLESENAGKIKD